MPTRLEDMGERDRHCWRRAPHTFGHRFVVVLKCLAGNAGPLTVRTCLIPPHPVGSDPPKENAVVVVGQVVRVWALVYVVGHGGLVETTEDLLQAAANRPEVTFPAGAAFKSVIQSGVRGAGNL